MMGKLLVHVAENGHSFKVECNEYTLVEAVQKALELICGISCNDQLLLCSFMKLDSHCPLSDYKLPSDERDVFLFNKANMRGNSPHPPPEKVEIVNMPIDPPLPSSSHNSHPLDDASDPALKALPSYERQFLYHFQLGDAIYNRTLAKFETCKRLSQEQKVQERALDISRGNLDHFYRKIQSYTDFMKGYSRMHRSHTNLLANFGRYKEKLRSIQLLPSLRNARFKCLLDFVKEENLQKSWEECSCLLKLVENKVSEFNVDFVDLKSSAGHILSEKTPHRIEALELSIKDCQQFINEQKTIMQALSDDVNTVKKLVDDCLSSQMSSSLRPHDAVSALGPMYDSHDKSYLPKMQSCEREISSFLDFCRDKKNEMNTFVHVFMQKIACIQYDIKDVRYKFSVFQEALNQLNKQFDQLKVVRRIGPAYRSCLAEIVRRKEAKKLYMGKAGQLAEKLASERDAEVRRREEFLRVHMAYIPRDVIASMGLYSIPNPCSVYVAPFDCDLLDIDISGLESYAPESLLGLSSTSEKHATLRSSSSMSNDESQADEVEGTTELPKNYEYRDLLESSELFEIGGTSKMEVENAKLKAELASKIALICSMSAELDYESLDDNKLDSLLKNAAEKTTEALHLKDEYEKRLESMLETKQLQCESYEKRIHELEQRLSDQNGQGRKLSADEHVPIVVSTLKTGDNKLEVSGVVEVHTNHTVELFRASSPLKSEIHAEHDKPQEELDDNMMDSSRSMLDLHHDGGHLCGEDNKTTDSGMGLVTINMAISMTRPPPVPSCETAGSDDGFLLELQNSLAEKSRQLENAETKIKELIDEVSKLGGELDVNRKLLDESQMNCARLEKCLHEAREEAQARLCAVERRISECAALHLSTIKMHGFFESLRSSITSVEIAEFFDSLCALAQSLASCPSETDDERCAEFREFIQKLSDKVSVLSRQHTELLDRSSKAEEANELRYKELIEKKELVNTLHLKNQREKQANKEKISYNELQVDDTAAFILNSSGHYEAINLSSPHHYYLSPESVASYSGHPLTQRSYIVGQVVHIEGKTVEPSSDKAASNPYGLPIGCEYFVVKIATVGDSEEQSVSS